MVPFGSVAFPMVVIKGLEAAEDIRGLRPVCIGTKGVTPAIGVKGESPGLAIEIGVNMPRFAPGIMGMLGTRPIPAGRTHKRVHPLYHTVTNINVYNMYEAIQLWRHLAACNTVPYPRLFIAEVGLLSLGAGTGGCFMMIGRAEGSGVPWSFSLISFIAMENSNLSIFPSLFISARALRCRGETKRERKEQVLISANTLRTLCSKIMYV